MVSRGGASLVQREPVFSKDGKRLLICTACNVTVYSVQTGEILTVLRGHTDVVHSVVVVPVATAFYCWTAGADGSVRFWDYAAGVLLKTVVVGHPILSMAIPGLRKTSEPEERTQGKGKRKHLIAFLSVGWLKKRNGVLVEEEELRGRVICHNLTTGKPISGHLAKTISPKALYVSPGGGLVGTIDIMKLYIWMVPQDAINGAGQILFTILHHTRRLTVVAFDSRESRVAAGDVTGRILIWENVGEKSFGGDGIEEVVVKDEWIQTDTAEWIKVQDRRRPGGGARKYDDAGALTTYHWHANAVKSLVFTLDGVYLLSGGMEGVLVIWQLETGKKNFLPRIGGPLTFIAPSPHPSLYAIACMDNSVKLLNIGTMEVERSFHGIVPSFQTPKQMTSHPSSMVSIEPSEGNIVVASQNLSLQFYDIASDKQVVEVQVTPRNYVTGSRGAEEVEGPSTCVTHIAFSSDGSCMATVDLRIAEGSIGGGACLKFWEKEPRSLRYSVNTVIDEPNGISALSFHPRERMAVSCSNTDFKVWVPHERSSSKLSWRCRSVGSYRQRSMLAAAFSPDGSVLAVAASELVTLWNPATNSLIRVLSNTTFSHSKSSSIHHLAFVNHSNCLVTASSDRESLLTVWDLSILSVRWCQTIEVESLSIDPVRASFAVLAGIPSGSRITGFRSRNGVVALFDVEKPVPLQYWTVPDALGGVVLFNPVSQTLAEAAPEERDDNKMTDLAVPSKGKLTYITGSREFVSFNPYQTKEEELGQDQDQSVTRNASVPAEVSSAFAAMYGSAVQPKKNLDAPAEVLSALSRAPWGTLLNGPSHVLPSLSVVCIPFMDSLMKKRTERI